MMYEKYFSLIMEENVIINCREILKSFNKTVIVYSLLKKRLNKS